MSSNKEFNVYTSVIGHKTIKSIITDNWLSGSSDTAQSNLPRFYQFDKIKFKTKQGFDNYFSSLEKFNNKIFYESGIDIYKHTNQNHLFNSYISTNTLFRHSDFVNGIFTTTNPKRVGVLKDIVFTPFIVDMQFANQGVILNKFDKKFYRNWIMTLGVADKAFFLKPKILKHQKTEMNPPLTQCFITSRKII